MIASIVKKMVCYINLVDVCFYLHWGQYVPLYYPKSSLRISAFIIIALYSSSRLLS